MDEPLPSDKSDGRPLSFWFVQFLTVARVPLAILFSILLLNGDDRRAIGALIVLSAIEVTDLLDGFVARRLRVASELGATLDPLADSVSRLTVYWSLAVDGLCHAVVPLVMAIRDVVVAYSRIVVARSGGSAAANWLGKIKAIVQGAAAFLLVWGLVISERNAEMSALLSWIVGGVTAVSAVPYCYNAYTRMTSARNSRRE